MRRPLATIALLGILAALPAAGAPRADCPAELVPKASTPNGAESQADRKFRRELEMVANVEVAWRSCSDMPGFASTFRPAYEDWTRKYRHALQRYQQNAHARRYVDCGIEAERQRMQTASESSRKQKADLCRDVMGPGIVRLVDGD